MGAEINSRPVEDHGRRSILQRDHGEISRCTGVWCADARQGAQSGDKKSFHTYHHTNASDAAVTTRGVVGIKAPNAAHVAEERIDTERLALES